MADPPKDQTDPAKSAAWPLVLALAVVLLVMLVVAFRRGEVEPLDPVDSAGESTGVVTLEQRRPESEPLVLQTPHTAGMTVLRATRLAGEREAAWASEWRGEGEMALLESLGGEPNQGPDGLNWQFEVNGVYADRGAGAYELAPGDRVLWKLAPYE